MRFLADMPISKTTVKYLNSQGHDAIHLLGLGLEKAKDEDIAKLAAKEDRILLTMDLDFAHIAAATKLRKPSVIIFRLRDNRPITINKLLEQFLSKSASDLDVGAIAIFEEGRVRIASSLYKCYLIP